MIFEPSHIKQTIFNNSDNCKIAGTSLNDIVYNQNKNIVNGNIEIPKIPEQFKELVVLTGLSIENNSLYNQQIGGCNNIIKSSDVNTISDDLFQKLFDKITISKNKSKKNKPNIKKNKTKRQRWFV